MNSVQTPSTVVVPAERKCPRCGAMLGGFGPEGLCGACMFGVAIEAEETITIPELLASGARRFGDYELLEEIGRGGMGVIFKARQLSLDRIVAVKMILRGEFAGVAELARFRAEAETAARLQHPDIVAIHEVGEREGQPFFSMDYVEGQDLAQLVGSTPLPASRAAKYLKTIAEAVQYAHEQGVLHRDLKPSNVLIDANDQPRVTDFGLAKRLEGDASLTLTGQVLGSPNFMPPEQAAGKGDTIGPTSDVYSLGAILYHALTGRPPFVAESVTATLRLVAESEAVSPRLLNASVSRDLETICLKCLEKEPHRRYATAEALAQDLGHFLRGEPIRARPVKTWEHLAKWIRRHPVPAALLTALVSVFVLGFTGVLWQWRSANFNAQAEASQRQRAEVNFQKAREVVDRMFTRVAEELKDVPRAEQIRRKLLEDALVFYQDFLKQRGNDTAVRHEAALTYSRVGLIYLQLGRYDKALESSGQALAMLEDLAHRHPTEPRYREALAEVHDTMSFANYSTARLAEALAHSREALSLYEVLQHEFPAVPGYLRQTAEAQVNLGTALGDVGRFDEGIDHCRQALKLLEKQRAALPDLPEHGGLLAHIHHWLGSLLEKAGQLGEAEAEYREALGRRKQQVVEQPHNAYSKSSVAHINRYLANLLRKTGRPGEAEKLLRQAVEIREVLLSDFPDHAEFRRLAADDYMDIAQLLTSLGRTPEAEAALRRSLAIRGESAANLSGASQNTRGLAWSHYDLGILLESTGRSNEAAEHFRTAIAMYEKLAAESPGTARIQHHLGFMLATCPAAQFRDLPRAVILFQHVLELSPGSADDWGLLGFAQYRTGNPAAAIESLNKSSKLGNDGDARLWLFLAMSHWKNGDREQARNWYDKAVAWIEKNRSADEELKRFRAEAVETLGIQKAR